MPPGAASRAAVRRPLRAVARAVAAGWAAAVLLSGCGAAVDTIGPTGIDTLVVPTPSPDPDDFVTGTDQRWAPLRPGARWTYETTGPDGDGVRTVAVEGTRTIAGLPAVAVRTTSEGPGPDAADVVRWYAQDRAGHLWLLGEEGRWLLGEETDAAGLAVPAAPRVGDGYVAAEAPGLRETVRVAETGVELTVPAGDYEEVVRLVVSTEAGEEHVHLAPGVGEVLRLSDSGRVRSALVEHVPGE